MKLKKIGVFVLNAIAIIFAIMAFLHKLDIAIAVIFSWFAIIASLFFNKKAAAMEDSDLEKPSGTVRKSILVLALLLLLSSNILTFRVLGNNPNTEVKSTTE